MPIFEYKCKKCKHQFEALVRSGEEKPSCPKCASKNLEKLISGFNAGKGSETSCGNHCCGGSGHGHVCGAGCGCHK